MGRKTLKCIYITAGMKVFQPLGSGHKYAYLLTSQFCQAVTLALNMVMVLAMAFSLLSLPGLGLLSLSPYPQEIQHR